MALKIAGKNGSAYMLVEETVPLDEPLGSHVPARVLDTDRNTLFETQWAGSILKFMPGYEEHPPDTDLLKSMLADDELTVRGAPATEVGIPQQELDKDGNRRRPRD